MTLLWIIVAIMAGVSIWNAPLWWRQYQRRLRVKLEAVPPGPDIEPQVASELGPVRVRPRDNFSDQRTSASATSRVIEPRLTSAVTAHMNSEIDDFPVLHHRDEMKVDARMNSNQMADESRDMPVSSHVSVMMAAEVVSESPTKMPQSFYADTAVQQQAPDTRSQIPQPDVVVSTDEMPTMADSAQTSVETLSATPSDTAVSTTPDSDEVQHDLFAGIPVTPPASVMASTRASRLYETDVAPVNVAPKAAETRSYQEIDDVIALHVVAGNELFQGEELLRLVLAYGLRFGDMSIFHRHEHPSGQGKILFSMAKAVEPGTFDLSNMTREQIPGVSFFLSLPGVNSIHAYDIMVDTVRRLAHELRGTILDEQQHPLTRQLIEHYRERVQEFERRRLMSRATGH